PNAHGELRPASGINKELQRIRGLAILMVLIGHMPVAVPPFLMHGYTGVTMFFVISGYVATLSFYHTYPKYASSGKWQYIVDTYLNKFFRVIMVILAAVFIYGGIALILHFFGIGYGDKTRWKNELLWLFSGAYNYLFSLSGLSGLFGHFWSLYVELHFYLIFPFFMCFIKKDRMKMAVCIAIIILVSTVGRALTPEVNIGMFTHTQIDAIFVGVLIGIFFQTNGRHQISCNPSANPMLIGLKKRICHWENSKAKQSQKADNHTFLRFFMNAVTLILVVSLLLLPYFWDGGIVPNMIKYPVFVLLSGLLIVIAVQQKGYVFGKVSSKNILGRFLEYIGNRSYSIYIIHIILYSGIYANILYSNEKLSVYLSQINGIGTLLHIAVLYVLAIVGGEIFYQLVEKPYSQYGRSLISKRGKRTNEKS
ncbi:MAG: acyltransferase, partial [Christensenellaceae bacterium]